MVLFASRLLISSIHRNGKNHYISKAVFAHLSHSRIASRGGHMEESLCNVEFIKENNDYVARVQSEIGGLREYRSSSLEEVLEQVIIDLQEEFETAG